MGRTTTPITPGSPEVKDLETTTEQAQKQDGAVDLQAAQDAADALPAGVPDKVDMVSVPSATLAEMQAQIRHLMAAQRNAAVAGQGPAEPVKLPTEAEAIADSPSTPVLTTKGWYVPESKDWIVTKKVG